MRENFKKFLKKIMQGTEYVRRGVDTMYVNARFLFSLKLRRNFKIFIPKFIVLKTET